MANPAAAVARLRSAVDRQRAYALEQRRTFEAMTPTQRREHQHNERQEKVAVLIGFAVGMFVGGLGVSAIVQAGEMVAQHLTTVSTDVGNAFLGLLLAAMAAAMAVGLWFGRRAYGVVRTYQARGSAAVVQEAGQ